MTQNVEEIKTAKTDNNFLSSHYLGALSHCTLWAGNTLLGEWFVDADEFEAIAHLIDEEL